jgi:small subunit ribosomal protein S5
MAEKESINQPKDMVEAVPEEVKKIEGEPEVRELEPKEYKRPARADPQERAKQDAERAVESWIPKTALGKLVNSGKERDLDRILTSHKKILEPEIVDKLISPDSDMISIGQAKGKFGGGKRRAWRQTQKKTKEGNVLTFSSMAIVGDRKGHVGIGFGKAKETLPTREKSLRNAKLNILKINLGFESPESEPEGAAPHTIPFKVRGKSGGVRLTLWPAPRGTGLVIGDECKKILNLSGIKDIYSKSEGGTKTTFNLAKACVDALSKTTEMKQ